MALTHGSYLQWHLHGYRGELRHQLVDAFESLSLEQSMQTGIEIKQGIGRWICLFPNNSIA